MKTAERGAPRLKSRVAMFVFNEVSHDRRVLLEADALQEAGWQVTIHGVRKVGSLALAVESRPSGVQISRHQLGDRPAFPLAMGHLRRAILMAAWHTARFGASLLTLLRTAQGQQLGTAINLWGWATQANAASAEDTILHAHDLTGGIPVLMSKSAPAQTVVYDSHEVFLESGRLARSPRALRSLVGAAFEQPLLRRASALITVNPSVEGALEQKYRLPTRREVVYNCADPLQLSEAGTRLIRTAIGVGDDAVVALYHGGFTPVRGLRQIIEASHDARLAETHFVFMGYGPMEEELRARAAESERIHVLPAVAPEVLADWISGASVGLMPNLPESLNEYYSTPNKLFESIAAGVPVVSSDFPERRRIILDAEVGPLGAVCEPSNPQDLARAIHEVTTGGQSARDAYRRRCLNAAANEWNWDAQAKKLVALYENLERSSEAGN
jgi:glycosyltransferase involved in cell wall biosynthesis